MAKPEHKYSSYYPDCILLEDGTVLPWAKASLEMQTAWLQEHRLGHHFNNGPDKGHNKGNRKKQRRSRHHS